MWSAMLAAAAVGAAVLCPPCPRDRYNCDERIDSDPSGFTCRELERDHGCNCSGCARCGSPAPPGPPPNAADLVLLRPERHPEARCLDGSVAGFYLRKGAADKFLVFFEGGGWCYDSDCESPSAQGTLADCRRRSSTSLGSSKRWPPKQDSGLTGITSADPRSNPVFHDWTLVYVPYCDGTSFSGDAVVDGLYFKGKAILDAVLSELVETTAVRAAARVVVSGGSAGASTVLYHIDSIADRLRAEGGEVVGLADAGFFLDLKDKDGIDCWPNQMRSIFNVSNGYASLNKECLARFPVQQWRCLFPQYYADLVRQRLFLVNSLYDSSELWYTLRLDCCPPGTCSGYPVCSGRQQQLFEAMREQHIDGWRAVAARKGNGVWAPGCIAHTLTWEHWTDAAWEVPEGSGNTQAAVVAKWLAGDDADYEDSSWPNNARCASSSLNATR